MDLLWESSPLTASQIVGRIAPTRGWNPKTVKTLLSRLVKKGALGFKTEGKRYWYSPLVSRDACVRTKSRSFVSQVFGGAVGPMLVHFVSESTLSADDIRKLRELLDRKEQKGK